jgi:hypothetical protein
MPEGANAALDLFAMVFSSVVEISFTPFYAVGLLVSFLSYRSKPCAGEDN